MMLLKHIYLYLNLDEFPDELATPFGFQTRYVCNFLERRLAELRFHADGFSKICVQGKRALDESCPILSEKAAVPGVVIDQAHYAELSPDGYHEFFLGMLTDGLHKCARHHAIPLGSLLETMEKFRRGDYRNQWTHVTKTLRPSGLRATLLCSLDSQRFSLVLHLSRKGQVVYDRQILVTKPDEIIFAHRFKQLIQGGDTLSVLDKFGRSTFSLDLTSLG
jgi:hypothetical protein